MCYELEDEEWATILGVTVGRTVAGSTTGVGPYTTCYNRFSPYLYRARNLVERFFNKVRHCRRVATRYDKLTANYLAFIELVSIRLWLRANESTS